MKILALDLGTKTGVAANWEPPWLHGAPAITLQLGAPKEITGWRKQRQTRRGDPRVDRLYFFLRGLHPDPDLVVFEDVEFSSYTAQTQLWSSLRSAVWLAFTGISVVDCVSVTTLKKFATGAGNADKAMMEFAALKQCPELKKFKLDDNAIDAWWLLQWAEKHLGRMPL